MFDADHRVSTNGVDQLGPVDPSSGSVPKPTPVIPPHQMTVRAMRLSRRLARLSLTLQQHAVERLQAKQRLEEIKQIKQSTTWRLAEPIHRRVEQYQWVQYLLQRFARGMLPESDNTIGSNKRSLNADVAAVLGSGLFDARWYRRQYPSAPADPALAARHYLRNTAPADPGPQFDARWYLENNPDARGKNPLLHYVKTGRERLRPISLAAQQATQGTRRKALGLDLEVPQMRLTVGFAGNASDFELARAKRSAALAAARAGLRDFTVHNLTQFDGSIAGTHNALLERAASSDAELYIAADPTGIFDPGCLTAMLRMSVATGHRALIAATDFPQENPIAFDATNFDVGWAGGGCLLIPLSLIREIGACEPGLDRFWDVDLSWRARQAGFGLKTCPSALFHVQRDHVFNDWLDEDQLQAGYRLAKLWGHENAADEIAAELRRSGQTSVEAPPANGRNPDMADFAHGFGFAPMRW